MKLLKDSAVALAKPLTLLMNRSLAEGAIPSDWKHASVTPIHKAGPLLMLPTIGQSLLYLSLLRFSSVLFTSWFTLQDNWLLSIYQSGYRPQHSTSTCLIDVTNK